MCVFLYNPILIFIFPPYIIYTFIWASGQSKEKSRKIKGLAVPTSFLRSGQCPLVFGHDTKKPLIGSGLVELLGWIAKKAHRPRC